MWCGVVVCGAMWWYVVGAMWWSSRDLVEELLATLEVQLLAEDFNRNLLTVWTFDPIPEDGIEVFGDHLVCGVM